MLLFVLCQAGAAGVPWTTPLCYHPSDPQHLQARGLYGERSGMSWRKVVVTRDEFAPGAPIEIRPGVKDWKLIYPDTGVPSRTLIMGIVEIAPGQHSPLHRHTVRSMNEATLEPRPHSPGERGLRVE